LAAGAEPARLPAELCAAAMTAAEHAAEDVLEALAPAAARREAGAAGAHGADLVVLRPLLRVGEHGVRLADLLELGLGRGIARVGVRVVLARELAVGLLDLSL